MKNYVNEIKKIVKDSPNITTAMIVFKAKALVNEDQFEKKNRIKRAVYRTSRLHHIRKTATDPVRWALNPN